MSFVHIKEEKGCNKGGSEAERDHWGKEEDMAAADGIVMREDGK